LAEILHYYWVLFIFQLREASDSALSDTEKNEYPFDSNAVLVLYRLYCSIAFNYV